MRRAPSQIPIRVKYFVGVRDVSGTGVGDAGTPLFSLDAGEHINVSSTAVASAVTSAPGYTIYPLDITGDPNVLVKDMGREIVIYDDATGAHVSTYRQVQRVYGATTEGVNTLGGDVTAYTANFYIRVWAADGTNIGFARIG